jgi:hypothetical protein
VTAGLARKKPTAKVCSAPFANRTRHEWTRHVPSHSENGTRGDGTITPL